ncbi:MAG TPA: penicillin acylase family protein [Longimicrobiaceae bacterium]|nr:penicillin acylase family protein [Longimicrobiaceae bacterium]
MKVRTPLSALVLLALLPVASGLAGQETTTLRIEGVQQSVEIIRDTWGIPHIYAQNEADLFFAQGYNAARDRLFQLEVWRRQATGTVAEILGPRELDRDIGTRLLKFRGDMRQELNHYHPRGELIVNSFVRGINAYIAQTERNPDLLPIEFELLGIRPHPWTAEVVISRHQGLIGNVRNELNWARAVALLGADSVARIAYFEPTTPDLTIDPAIDPQLLFQDILHLYDESRSSLRFQPEDVVAEHRADPDAYRLLATAVPDERTLSRAGEDIGSNNWIISGDLTMSGRPIMANDPHRAITAPSLRYWAHLVAPGWNVIGGGEPALPGISIGHNEYGAWGLTVFSLDSEDLYVYETNPANPNQYRYQGAWETMRVVRETIPVRGRAPVEVELKYTRHGPVMFEDAARNVAFAVRAGWLEVGGAPYLASLRMDQARNWEEFRDASSYSHIPGENMVWADVHGDIGWQAVGIAPIRRSWSGLIPVPGDGRYEWDGYLPIRELPHLSNPDAGYWGNGNDFVPPRDYDQWDAITFAGWTDPFRGSRVRELLASGRRFNVSDMMRFQHDALSIPARSIVPLLLSLEPRSGRAREAIDWLRDWDYVLDRRSVPAGIYVEFERQLLRNMRDLAVPARVRDYLGISMKRTIDWLNSPDAKFGDDPVAGRNTFLLHNLELALDELGRKLGSGMDEWEYGEYKHARHLHPLSPAVSPEMRERLEVGGAPRDGYNYTVLASGGGDNQTSGASFRIIAPIEDWDLTVGTQTPGQGGDPDDPMYRNLYSLWQTNQYFPVYYSREKINQVAEQVTILQPR